MRYYIISLLSAIFVAAVSTGCSDELPVSYDYTVAGQEVTVTVPVSLPKMEVKSRADLDNPGLNRVESLWVAVYSAGAGGGMTSEGWTKLTPGTEDREVAHEVTLKAKSGPSFIVAVANVDNMGVTRNSDGGPSEEQPISTLLEAADTWEKFLAIAVVTPHLQQNVNAPTPPLPMAGAYTTLGVGTHPQRPLSQWATENFQHYTIPASTNGTVKLENGAIHMRRTVSQIKFNIKAGNSKIKITPHSYRVVNVPVYSWLYERGKDDGNIYANFGDACTNSNPEDASYKTNYYASPGAYGQSFITNNLNAQGVTESYTFSFWQGENKHTGNADSYKARDMQVQEDGKNTGMFKALVNGDTWSANNMATYVIINCTVDYIGELLVDQKGNQYANPEDYKGNDEDLPQGFDWAHRTAVANYIIHLGYVGGKDVAESEKSKDFNCYRNVKYTYNVTVNGVDDILVEAFNNGQTPGVEGTVTDIGNASVLLDCHYHAYNIQLSDDDLEKWSEGENGPKGFGFLLTTYDNANGGEQSYNEEKLIREAKYTSYNDIPKDIKKYLDWVELRPTEEGKLAKYRPRDGEHSDGKTFNLVDASLGISAKQKSETGWYTVFVNEYTYEAKGADESVFGADGKPLWQSYVGADPRRFYIKVTRGTSNDGESIYVRSKYAGTQRSILSYYSTDVTTEPEVTGQVKGSAVGVECENEVFGLNLRRSFISARNTVNGRWNTSEFTKYTFTKAASSTGIGSWSKTRTGSGTDGCGSWDYFVKEETPLKIPKVEIAGYSVPGLLPQDARTEKLPALVAFRDNLVNQTYVNDKEETVEYGSNGDNGNTLLNKPTQYDPQLNATNSDYYIEAINACMNRNRDNNGNGYIDPEEIRWYVPAAGKYLRIILGYTALNPEQLINYQEISKMPYNETKKDGPFMFYTSDGRVLWAMEGMSTSNWCQWGIESPVAPWQVRCIRNLGTNLSKVSDIDQTVPAYTKEVLSDGRIRIYPKYYNQSTLRVNRYEGNGTEEGQMPVHSLANTAYNSIYRGGFEINPTYQTALNGYWEVIMNLIQSDDNPCNTLTVDGGGWRLPNVNELAIMRNLGIIGRNYTLSCSMGAFDGKGNRVTPEDNPGNKHFFMSAIGNNVTQETQDPATYQILCVRDLR